MGTMFDRGRKQHESAALAQACGNLAAGALRAQQSTLGPPLNGYAGAHRKLTQ